VSDDKSTTMKWWIDRAKEQEIQLGMYKAYTERRDIKIMEMMLERNTAYKLSNRWQHIAEMLYNALTSGDEQQITAAKELFEEYYRG